MKRILFLGLLSVIFLFGCSTNNEITNKTYEVDIKINNISEALIPASEKALQSSIGVSSYIRGSIFGTWVLDSVGSGVVYSGYATLNDGTKISDITDTKNRDDVKTYTYRAITNYHVINVGNNDVANKVYLSRIDLLLDCKVLGYNVYEDLAIVEFNTTVYIPLISFGSSDSLKSGELVLAVGNPEGYEYADSVSFGIISNPKRYVTVNRDTNNDGRNDWEGTCEYLQHDAAINSGNSGGSLVNIKGELVGINTLKLIDKNNTIEGMGFAIPIDIVKKYISDLEHGKSIKLREFKGTIFNINHIINKEIYKDIPNIKLPLGFNKEYGVFVYDSTEFGLKNGDIIIGLNGNNIYNKEMLNEIIRNDINDTLTWNIYRDGKYLEVLYQVKE